MTNTTHCLTLLLWALTSPFLLAQDLPRGAFDDVLDVQVVHIEVVVTDREGLRVRGLGSDSMKLLVDGVEQPIEYFTEVRGGVARPPVSGTGRLPEVQVPEVRPGQAVGTSTLVFIDEFLALKQDRDRVLSELRRQLSYLGANDRMSVVAFDGRKLSMLSSWSQSTSALDRVLASAMERPALGLRRVADLRQLNRDAVGRRPSRGATQGNYYLNLDELYYAQLIEDQLERSVAAAASTLRSFGIPPGRKVMLLLSGGWPNHPAEFVVNDYHRSILDSQVKRGPEIFRPLIDTANLLGYTLYPVDVPGFQGLDSQVDVTRRSVSSGGISLRESDMHHTLEYLASSTGGKALINSKRLTAMEEVHEDLSSYYWIGFTPQRVGNDETRTVEVLVDNRDLSVRHRRGFQDFSRASEVTMSVESALLFGHRPEGSALQASLGKAKRSGIGKVTLPLIVRIPLDLVTLVPYGNQWVGQVELRVAVQDESGQMAPIPVITLRLTLDEKPGPGGTDVFETSLKIRKAQHDLVISIHDPASGRSALAFQSYQP